jgi:hypothetical protein
VYFGKIVVYTNHYFSIGIFFELIIQ